MQRSCWGVEQFRLREQIHAGSGSRVHAAVDLMSGMHVALKMYPKRKLSPLGRYQVEREIRLHLQLEHENIIRLYAAFEDEQGVYLVQELATGGDLFHRIKDWGGGEQREEARVVQDFMLPFLTALKHIHGKGIIHRDIKPENLILTADGVLKLADFGLAINMNEERPVTRAGTLQYMAPEVLVCPEKALPEENKERKELAYTAQVDVWAGGILAYELLLGHTPFGKDARQLTPEYVMNVIDKQPDLPFWMSKDAKAFIKTALCKDPSARPTAKQLLKQPWIRQHSSSRRTSSLTGRSTDGAPSPGPSGSPEPFPSPDHAACRHPRSGVLSDDSLFGSMVGRALSYAAAPSLHPTGPAGSPCALTRNNSVPFEGSPCNSPLSPLNALDTPRRDPDQPPQPQSHPSNSNSPSAAIQRTIPSGRRKLTSLIDKMVRGAPTPGGSVSATGLSPQGGGADQQHLAGSSVRDRREEAGSRGQLQPQSQFLREASSRRKTMMATPSARPGHMVSSSSTSRLLTARHSALEPSSASPASGAVTLPRSYRSSSVSEYASTPAKPPLPLTHSLSRPPSNTTAGLRHLPSSLTGAEGVRSLSSRKDGAPGR